jgi:hypothetical protein
MKFFYLSALLFMGVCSAFAQQATLSRIKFNQDNGTVTIYYTISDVKSDNSFLAIRVTAISHGQNIPLKTATGDLGKGVSPLGEKTIVWDAFQDNLQDTMALNFKFEIIALPGKYAQNGAKLSAPGRIKGPLITMGVGVGICAAALVPYSQSKSLYSTYETHLNPSYMDYTTDFTRDNHFEKANSKFLTAQVIAAAGGVVILTGVISWVKFKKRQKKWNTIQSWSLEPTVLDNPAASTIGWSAAPMGMKMTFNLSK